jgi:PAS domain S-box-containing protein
LSPTRKAESQEELLARNRELQARLDEAEETLRALRSQPLTPAAEPEIDGELLRAAFSSIGDAVIATDAGGRVTILNPAASRLSGWGSDQAIGRAVSDVLRVAGELAGIDEVVERVLREARTVAPANDTTLVARDGREIPVETTAAPIRDRAGKVQGVVLVLRDVGERRRPEKAARGGSAQLSVAFDAYRGGMWEWALRTNKSVWSDELWGVYALEPNSRESSYETWLQRVYYEDRPMAEQIVLECSRDGRPIELEFRVPYPDGTLHWVMMIGQPIRDAGGQVERYVGIAVDVTVRKLAEEALHESEERFRTIYEYGPGGIASIDLDGRFISTNRAFLNIVGYEEHELLGRSFHEITFEDDVPAQKALLREMLDGERDHFAMEKRYVRKDGILVWVALSAAGVRNAAGRLDYALMAVQDITERKRVVALSESEQHFRRLANSAPVMIWETDGEGLVTFVNTTLLTFIGHTLEQELGSGWLESVHPDDRERILARVTAFRVARRDFRLQYRMQRADGEYRFVNCNGVARFDADGSFAGYIGSCLDMTELKRNQEEAVARQKLESLGVLASGIAHDFNNSLSGILASAEMLMLDMDESSPYWEELERIKNVAIRGSEIVRQLMVYAGEESAVLEDVDLALLIGEMLDLMQLSISKRAAMKVDLPKDLPIIRANQAQLRQVAMNLITNASEALGTEGGTISVSLAPVNVGANNRISGLRAGNYLRLQVADTGCGMTEGIKARIFDPFFTTKPTGRGLGLSAVRGIISSHGGGINLTSEPGHGTCFEILLPVAGALSSGTRVTPVAPPMNENAVGTVLIVEDEDALRHPTAKMLRRTGFTVLEAGDGRDAAEQFRTHAENVDAVLLDLTLPGVSGPEILRELYRIRPDVKVVITTAFSWEHVKAEIGDHPPSMFIRKPYNLADLSQLLLKVASG